MAIEIERKFLVADDGWQAGVTASRTIVQAYLASSDRAVVRVRIADDGAWLTVKSRRVGPSRVEVEVPVARADAEALVGLSDAVVEKTRHLVPVEGVTFEVDEFGGANAGLVMAEVELPAEDASFPRPAWLGAEVTLDKRYHNSYLAEHGFASWGAGQPSA